MSKKNSTKIPADVKAAANKQKSIARKSAFVYSDAVRYHVSDDNKKLVPNFESAFYIWNLPAIITCPCATIMCMADCYAVKSENAYPEVFPARMENLRMSQMPSFVDDMSAMIIKRAKTMRKHRLICRIHESGDFYCQRYADDWIEIVRRVEAADLGGKEVIFIAYTKSFRFFDGKVLPKSFRLRASVWADTAPDQLEIIARNGWPVYTAVEKFSDTDTFHQCRCEDCATCGKCWDMSVPLICCEIH